MTRTPLASFLRLCLLAVLLIGAIGQPQFKVSAAATNVNTITIPSTPAGGAGVGYTVGEVVTIRVNFTGNETVTGTPTILINVGGNFRLAKYSSGSGTANLDFTYTVVAGDADANGISVAANSLALSGGSINNGIDAAQITHLALADQATDIIAASVAALDTTAPVLRSALGAGSSITLFYDELGSGLRSTPLPPVGNFTFSRNGGVGPQLTVNSVLINHTANTVTLGLNGLISLTDTDMRVGYTANGTNDIQDVIGNKIANFSNVFVANTMPSFDVKGNALFFDNPSSITGDGRTVGNQVLFSNVITVDGQTIDAIVTTTSLSGATISGFDTLSGTATPALSTTPAAVDALWFKLNTNIGAGGGDITITFNFIKGGSYNAANLTATKGDDVILQNVAINSYDLDGAGGGATQFQYQEFGGYATYTVANNSALTQTQVGTLTHFQTTTGGNVTNSPGTDAGDQIRVQALYEAIHQFQIKTGAIATGGIAYYYIDFSKGPNWFNPTLAYEIPTVNPKTTNDTTPDITGTFTGCAYVSGSPSATIQAYTLTVTVNGKTYTAGETAAERTTLPGGNIQLLDATSGLRGEFSPTTCIGTWTLTIPPADALPLATYNVGVDVGYGTSLATINRHTVDNTTNELVINGTPADTTAPTFTSITRGNPTGENITPAALAIQNYVDFTVTFSEAVTNVDITDFQITGAGSTGSNISSVTQTGPTTYTVRVSNIPTTNLGVLDLNLLATNDVVDLGGNLLSGTTGAEGVDPTSGIDETYMISSTATISNFVWNDLDGDGVQDGGLEVGLNNVRVYIDSNGNNIYDVGEPTATTNASGIYSITGLAAGTYDVRVDTTTLPAGYNETFDLDGIASLNEVSVTVTAGQTRTDIDFGYQQQNAVISDFVWNDLDGDGIQDGGLEVGLVGVRVYIDGNGNNTYDVGERTATTAAGGLYSIDNLPAGTYDVRIDTTTLPAGYNETYDLDGIASLNEASVTVTAGQTRTDIDFGYQQQNAVISDFIWNDLDGDGVQDGGLEVGLNGVRVYVDSNGNNTYDVGERTATTAGGGLYSIGNLPAGTYDVRVDTTTLPAGYGETFDLDGIASLNEASVTVTAGQTRTDIDFGYQQQNAVISDFVWNDLDGDGVQDGGLEVGLVGVRVYVDSDNDNTYDVGEPTAITAAGGLYSIGGLAAGTYNVRVDTTTLPAGYAQTYDLNGGLDNEASVTLTTGQTRTDIDFGYQQQNAVISDFIWNDLDGDGVQDGGLEVGLVGVRVYVDSNGNDTYDVGERTATTAAGGLYSISNLAAGTYAVRVDTTTLPAGYAQTFDLDGIATNNEASVTLTAGQTRTDIDFGYQQQNAVISDFIWNDLDGDGVQDGGLEVGLNGVRVYIDGNGNDTYDVGERNATTAAGGLYSIGNLAAGTYAVRVDTTTLPAGYAQTYDLDGIATSNEASVTVTAGQTRTDVDFGYQQRNAVISDFIWNDLDGNGVQDGGLEVGLNGVRVYIDSDNDNTYDAGEPTATTAGGGLYSIGNLAAGTYNVRVDTTTLPAGYGQTYDLNGGLDNEASVTLTAGQTRTDVDFGYQQQNAVISDFVWNDIDGDGVQDGGLEVGIDGIRVYIDSNGNNTYDVGERTATTAGGGLYSITGLAPGTYAVRVDTTTLPAGTGQTYDLDGIGTGNEASVTVTIGQTRTDIDFGYQQQDAVISDFIWNDLDGDGVQDGGLEVGLNGVRVYIDSNGNDTYDVGERTATTNATGNYSIGNLAAGTYAIRVDTTTLPTGYGQTYDLDGIATGNEASVTVTAGQIRTDVDFGYRPATISDFVWNDIDGDGVQDGGLEVGFNNVRVYIDSNGNNTYDVGEPTATTNASGNYSITGIAAGTYAVRIDTTTLPAGYGQTYDLDGIGTSNEASVTVAAGQVRTDVDFGYQQQNAVISDFVWNDIDGDGVQDGGLEVGLANVRVYIDSNGNNTYDVGERTATTNASGNYSIGSLAAGTYAVRVDTTTLPADYRQTYDLDGIGTSNEASVALTAGQTRTDVDFAYQQTATIGDFIWNDIDGDGVQDGGLEVGIPGVTVYVDVDGSGTFNAGDLSDTTDGAGAYSITGITPGTYNVRIDPITTPGGYRLTTANDPTNTTLTAGEVDNTLDFGYQQTATVGDFIWNDIDGNGLQDGGLEVGLTGVTVYIDIDGSGTLNAGDLSDTTDGTGAYSITNIPPGTYNIRVDNPPAGYNLTTANDPTNTTLTAGEVDNTLDFGYQQTATISNFIWNDLDGDGVQDGGLEVGLDGVRVYVDSNGNNTYDVGEPTATTAGGGLYAIGNLAPGTYAVRVDTTTLPAGYAQTYDLDGVGTGNEASVAVTAGQTRTDVDFGYQQTATVGDFIWNDLDADGVQDGGLEVGLTGVTVFIDYDNDGVRDAGEPFDTSDAAGAYSITGITPGTYNIRVDNPPAGYNLTTANDPTNTTLTPGEVDNTLDFGYQQTATVGDFIWNDIDGDGVQDGGLEVGIPGVTVYVDVDGSGTLNAGDLSDTTDAAGAYSITGITPGTYNVRVNNPPAGYTLTTANDPTNTTLTAGEVDNTLDFGYQQPATIGDFIWNDIDGDGVQDGGLEVGLTGVTVFVDYDNDGVRDAGEPFDTSDGAGAYSITGITPGTYNIRIEPATIPAGYQLTTANNPTNTTLTAGEVDNTLDFGYQQQNAVISDFVWDDVDGDGVQDGGVEVGLNGVRVYIDSNNNNSYDVGEPNATTAGGGLYSIGNLAAGTYNVRVDTNTLAAGYGATYDLDGTGTLNEASVTVTAGQTRTDVDFGYQQQIGQIQIVKTPSATVVSSGGSVTYSYVVTNTAAVSLTNVSVTDDRCSPVTYVSGDLNTNNILETTETWNYTCTATLAATTTNIATAEARDPLNNLVQDTDTATVTVILNGSINKTIIGTDTGILPDFTLGNDVAIGEIVTYEITINLPVGLALNNVTVTDRMDKGLSLVDCLSVVVAGNNVTGTVCPPTVSSITDPGDSPANPANPGRQVEFNIGNIPAQPAASTLVIQYRAIVLDVIENQEGVALNNSVTWAWTGGSVSTSAPNVTIVEPDLDIVKSATPTTATVGTPIQFTLVITHTAPSTADAFDVVVTDILPAGLTYNPCTPITYTGLVPTTQPNVCALPAGNQLVFEWDAFPLGQTATIVFFATFNGTQPSVINTASVAWTSLPIDPAGVPPVPVQMSVHNVTSTERAYDPGVPVSIYQVFSSVSINAPATVAPTNNVVDLPDALPFTGFAPEVITKLPEQPAEKKYAETEVWLEIPSLGVNIPIVGVPLVNDDWDVSWLLNEAGWLNGTAFPGWEGNSALTAHVYLANGKPGPFVGINKLKWGDKIIIRAYGSLYTYEVRQNRTVAPTNTSVLKHEDESWLTLVTCKDYNERTTIYSSRIAVRAVLISVKEDNTDSARQSGR